MLFRHTNCTMKHYKYLLTAAGLLLVSTTILANNFRVQVAAYAEQVPWEHFWDAGVQGIYMQNDQNQIFRYFLGDYSTEEEALRIKNDIKTKGFKYARVIDLEEQRALCGTPCPFFTADMVYAHLSVEQTFLKVIFFDHETNALDVESMKTLDSLAMILIDNPTFRASIIGHTDSIGNYKENVSIAKRRIRIIRGYMVSRGVNVERIRNRIYVGEQPPARDKDDFGKELPKNKKYNRRVVVAILDSTGELLNESTAGQLELEQQKAAEIATPPKKPGEIGKD